MAEAESVTDVPWEVVDAVIDRARFERLQYEQLTEFAEKSQKRAEELRDEASAHRAKAEHCETWLDERAAGWRDDIEDEDEEGIEDDPPDSEA